MSELASTSVRPSRLKEGGKKEKKKGAYQHFCSWRNFLQILVPPSHALKFVSKSPSLQHPGAFQTAAFVLGLGVTDKVCWPFKPNVMGACLVDKDLG